MKLSPVPVRPLLLNSWDNPLALLPTASWRRSRSVRSDRRWLWPLGTLTVLAVLADPSLSLALAIGGGVFWGGQRGQPHGSPERRLVGTVGLSAAAMVGAYGLLALLHTGNLGLVWQGLETLALAIALGSLLRQRHQHDRRTQEQAWEGTIAQLTHPDELVRAIALRRLTRWAALGLTPAQQQELAAYCRLLLVRESTPALREAVLGLAEAVAPHLA